MKIVLSKLRQNFLVNVLKLFSISGVLFVFQACYGTPTDLVLDYEITGRVLSASSNEPVEGVQISVNNYLSGFSDQNGNFELWVERAASYKMKFEDIDAALHGDFSSLDTTITHTEQVPELTIKMKLK